MTESSYNTKDDTGLLAIQARLTASGDSECISLALSFLKHPPDQKIKVLDFGCGTGIVTASRFGNDPRFSVLAIDTDKFSTEFAAEHHPSENIAYQNISLTDIDHDRQFDIVFASYVLHHNPKPAALLSALWAHVSTPGAMIVRTCDDSLLQQNPKSRFLSDLEKRAQAAPGLSNRFHGHQLPGDIKSLSPQPLKIEVVGAHLNSESMRPN